MKTLILSDLHLGHPATRLHAFLPELQRLAERFDRVVINGDAFNDLQQDAQREVCGEQVRQLELALASRNGAPEFLTGNHDPAASDAHFAYFEEAGLLAFHGDYALDNPCPWLGQVGRDFERRFRAQAHGEGFAARAARYRSMQRAIPVDAYHLNDGQGAWRFLCRQFVPPTRGLTIAWYIWRAPGFVAAAAASFPKPVRAVSFGHIHLAGSWRRSGMAVYNTGSFMPFSRPHGVLVEGERVRCRPVKALLEGLGTRVAMPVQA